MPIKEGNHYISKHIKHISIQLNKLVVPIVSGPGIKELDIITHKTVSDDQYQTILQFTYLQEELAAYSVERN